MSVRRRASIAGLDFKNNFPNSSVSGNGFGRRMSIASLGSHKYGRAEDQSQSNNGGGGGGGLVVRHIPIVIEGEEHKNGEREERGLQSTNILNVPIRLGRSVDRSSTSSTESDNSVETSGRPTRYSDGTKKRQTIASVRKSSNPKYVVVEETVGADHCPVHGHHHHHHHHQNHHHHYIPPDQEGGGKRRAECGGKGVAAGDQLRPVFANPLQAPGLIRSSLTGPGGEEDNQVSQNRKSRGQRGQRGRPRHNNILTPIKENISQDTNTFHRNTRHGSCREGRKTKVGDEEEEEDRLVASKPFQRRWSVRLPLYSHSTPSTLEPRPSDSSQMVGLRGQRAALNQPAKTDVSSVSTSEMKAASSTVIGKAGPGAGGANDPRQPPCVGILKTPGRRKTSNNRVEFLDNLQEREIPGRYT